MKSKCVWEEIHGFSSLSEYKRFVNYIENQIENGLVLEIETDSEYERGEIYGGRWFKDNEGNDIWRLVEPDFPFKGLWEPVKKSASKNKPMGS